MTTYAKPTLKGFPTTGEVQINLSRVETLTVKIPDADFAQNSNAQLTLGVGSEPPIRVGTFASPAEGEETAPLKGVTLTLTNVDLNAFNEKNG